MRLLFAVQCHRFERRLAWQLSSIAEQLGDIPDILIDVATLVGTGYAGQVLSDVMRHCDHGFSLRQYPSVDRFAYRGYVRTDQILLARKSQCDWIFFADCDNVYPRNFFALLKKELEQIDAKDSRCVFSIDKYHTESTATDAAVIHGKDTYKENAYESAINIPKINKKNKNVAAGCMQVCALPSIMSRTGGAYVEKTKDCHLFNTGQGARSDIQFRRKMGGGRHIVLPPQIHLNHARDKEAGKHLETQR